MIQGKYPKMKKKKNNDIASGVDKGWLIPSFLYFFISFCSALFQTSDINSANIGSY